MSREWGSIDEAFVDVAKGIRKEIEKLNSVPSRDRSGPKTLVVDQWCHGDHPTIGEAIAAAPPGAKILVKPGIYDEGLILDKPLEIVGDGDLGEVIVRAIGKDAVLFKTTIGRI
ncbi:MAG TPA: hypothetical protein VLB04_07565, partial [Methanotrichaceae archaeon]|nr:hypothetical protein [Methanotrichaceae archaeon]